MPLCALLITQPELCFYIRYSVGAGGMASVLPLELLAHVFSFLNVENNRFHAAATTDINRAAADQKRFAQLQLVCRKFRAVFQTHPGIMSAVVLHHGFADSLWSSCFKWTKGRTGSIDTFIADCTQPSLDTALAGLGGQQAALETAVCLRCGSNSIDLLSIFSTLRSCTLSADHPFKLINLSPLGVLTALGSLELYMGRFSSMMPPPNLLTLSIHHSICDFDPVGVSLKGLQQLTVGGSQLSLLPSGIAACAGLQHLDCWLCTVWSNEADHTLYAGEEASGEFQVPAVISTLTCLTYLAMVHSGPLNGPVDGPIDLSNIYLLQSLRHLCLRSQDSPSSVTVSDGLTALRHLETLELHVSNKVSTGFGDMHADPDVELKLDVDWAALANLKHITIEADVFRCTANILTLLNITILEAVHFIGSQPGDASSSKSFAALAYALARCRPDVCLMLDTSDMASHIPVSAEGQFDLQDFPGA